MLNFRKATSVDKDAIRAFTEQTVRGVICFSFLMSSGAEFYENFLVGEADSEIKSIIFDTGDEYFLVFGDEFPELLPECHKTLMVYEKKEASGGTAQVLEGREIQDIYRLISGKEKLSFDDERRYVLRLRSKNAGYSEAFGIKKDGFPVSCASVSSMNERYGLIADVFTAMNERKKGYALDCLMTVTEFILSKGKIPVLLCDEKMCPYYKKAGFTVYEKM